MALAAVRRNYNSRLKISDIGRATREITGIHADRRGDVPYEHQNTARGDDLLGSMASSLAIMPNVRQSYTRSIRKIQPLVGLSPTGQFG
jgi:hypothetical protein